MFISGAALAAPEVALPQQTDMMVHDVDAVGDVVDSGHVEKHESGPPQFAIHTFPSQLFWLAVSFGTLYFLMSAAALPRIRQGIEARAEHIGHLLADARRLRDEAEKHKNDMSSATDAAYQKAHDVLNKAAAAAQDLANRRNHELEAVMQTKVKASEERIAMARVNALQSIREAAQMLVPAVLNKLAAMTLSDKDIANLVQDAETPAVGRQPLARGAA
jgi:F-type H+-transporting ATPase subunit b